MSKATGSGPFKRYAISRLGRVTIERGRFPPQNLNFFAPTTFKHLPVGGAIAITGTACCYEIVQQRQKNSVELAT